MTIKEQAKELANKRYPDPAREREREAFIEGYLAGDEDCYYYMLENPPKKI